MALERTKLPHEQEIGSLLRRVEKDIAALSRDHLQLASSELKTEIRSLSTRLIVVVGSILFVLYGIGLLLVSGSLAISLPLNYAFWGFLMVGGFFALLGGAGILFGIRMVKQATPQLTETKRVLAEDREALKQFPLGEERRAALRAVPQPERLLPAEPLPASAPPAPRATQPLRRFPYALGWPLGQIR